MVATHLITAAMAAVPMVTDQPEIVNVSSPCVHLVFLYREPFEVSLVSVGKYNLV